MMRRSFLEKIGLGERSSRRWWWLAFQPATDANGYGGRPGAPLMIAGTEGLVVTNALLLPIPNDPIMAYPCGARI